MTIAWASPATGGFVLAPDDGIDLLVDPNDRQRRWTVGLRLLLLVPVSAGLLAVGCIAGPIVIVTWPVTLVAGKVPLWAHRFLRGYLTASARTLASAMLLHDAWPGLRCWSGPAQDPVRLILPPRRALTIARRIELLFLGLLAAPVAVGASVAMAGWLIIAPWAWLTTLLLGRAPRVHFYASVALLRYYLRYQAYALMLTTRYPRHLTGDRGVSAATACLVLRPAARLLVTGYLLVGVLFYSALLYPVVGAPVLIRSGSGQASMWASVFPGEHEALSARIPDGLREFCRPVSGADRAALAAASCDLGALRKAPRQLSYQVFSDRAATVRAYDTVVAAMGIAKGADNQLCAQGQPGAGTWDIASSGPVGFFACGRRVDATGRPLLTVVWTVAEANLVGTLDSDSAGDLGLADITAYWASHALTVK